MGIMYYYERKLQKLLGLQSKTDYNKAIHFIMRGWSTLGNVYGYIGTIMVTSFILANRILNKNSENTNFYDEYLTEIRPYVHKFVWGMNIAQAIKAVFSMPRPNQKTKKYPKSKINPE